MPRVTVVDVGDGACTVLRCGCVGASCACPVAVLDCGAYKATHRDAADALHAVLGADGLKRLETIIVSHFDADHWQGLQILGRRASSSELADAVTVAYPRLPDRAPDTFAAERALYATTTGMRALDFLNVWSEKTLVRADPLCRGRTFRAADRQWHVLWPPRQLSPAGHRALDGAVRAVEELAERMAADGDSTLRDNLEAARQSPLGRRFHDEEELQGERLDPPPLDDESEWIEEREDDDDQIEADGVGRFPDLFEIPEQHRDEFARVAKRLARANNNLSLIIHDGGHLIAYGDAQQRLVSQALRGLGQRTFEVALAPHHGTITVPGPAIFPRAGACVAQAGDRHRPRWHRHVASHGQPRSCISTADVGTVSFW